MISERDKELLTETVRGALGQLGAFCEMLPSHLRSQFIASVALSAMTTLHQNNDTKALARVAEELRRLTRGQPPGQGVTIGDRVPSDPPKSKGH